MPAFLHPWAFVLLAAIPALYRLFRGSARRQNTDLLRFAPTQKRTSRSTRPAYLLFAALGFMIVAIAQPVWRGWEETPSGTGQDIVFLLDVSRSMFTHDGAGNKDSRLEQARAAIADIMNHAAGGRFGLVVFAGNSSVECPLTDDYPFLLNQLKSASRGSVTLGGTHIGDAIRFAARSVFDDASRNARELVLISDGGDDDSTPIKAAGELASRGIRLIVAGAGSESAAGLVPQSESNATPVLYRGKPVISKLDAAGLRRICRAGPHCVYANIANDPIPKIILDNGSLWKLSTGSGGQIACAALSIAAAILLAGERGR